MTTDKTTKKPLIARRGATVDDDVDEEPTTRRSVKTAKQPLIARRGATVDDDVDEGAGAAAGCQDGEAAVDRAAWGHRRRRETRSHAAAQCQDGEEAVDRAAWGHRRR